MSRACWSRAYQVGILFHFDIRRYPDNLKLKYSELIFTDFGKRFVHMKKRAETISKFANNSNFKLPCGVLINPFLQLHLSFWHVSPLRQSLSTLQPVRQNLSIQISPCKQFLSV